MSGSGIIDQQLIRVFKHHALSILDFQHLMIYIYIYIVVLFSEISSEKMLFYGTFVI